MNSRKKAVALLLAGSLFCCGAASAAEAGSAGNPLIALGWLKNTFIPDTVSQAQELVDRRMDQTEQSLSSDAAGAELRVKLGDVVRLDSGAVLVPLAGSLSAAAVGTVVDMTAGEELTGSTVSAGHQYLASERTQAAFSVTSDTAVIRLSGPYQLSPSAETDYNALAAALHEMGLFLGTDTPYGSGYDLESAPTRIQGLVLFLRLLGEEQAALAYTGSVTFADVPDWALPYAAYAYDKGYTKGQGIDGQWRVIFGSEDPLTARDYVTFLLRALGYVEGESFRWETALADAQSLGVLTGGEGAMLAQKPFLRAQTVYLSYFALDAAVPGQGGGTLLDRLVSAGAIDRAAAEAAMSGLGDQRL